MKNAGYTILKKEIFSQSEQIGIALGWNGKMGVTWEYQKNKNDEYSFYWGHYHTTYHSTVYEYHLRLAEAYRYRFEGEITND